MQKKKKKLLRRLEASTRTSLCAPPRDFSCKNSMNRLFGGRHDGSRACGQKPHRQATSFSSSSTVDNEESQQSPIRSVLENKLDSTMFKETHNASSSRGSIQLRVSWSDSIAEDIQSRLEREMADLKTENSNLRAKLQASLEHVGRLPHGQSLVGRRALILGGRPAGLSLAVSLGQRGCSVQVHERSAEAQTKRKGFGREGPRSSRRQGRLPW